MCRSRIRWTDDKIELLKKFYPTETKEELVKMFGCNWISINVKASYLKIKRFKMWDDEEIEILKKYYQELDENDLLLLLPKRDWEGIKNKASKLNISKHKNCILDMEKAKEQMLVPTNKTESNNNKHKNNKTRDWSLEEIEILKRLYSTATRREILCHLPERTWSGIKQRSGKLNISRNRSEIKGIKRRFLGERKTKNLEKLLLSEESEKYYWLGFLFADGHFNKYGISITLSIRDKQHLLKFYNYAESSSKIMDRPPHRFRDKNMTQPQVVVKLIDCDVSPQLMEKYEIDSRKTYNPPSIKIFQKMNDNQFLSWFVGFVDGDGSIINTLNKNGDKRFYLAVGCYITWKDVFEYTKNRLQKMFDYTTSGKNIYLEEKMVTFNINQMEVLQNIKRKIIELKLPVLDRKWDKIDLNCKSRTQKIEEKLISIEKSLSEGKSITDIYLEYGYKSPKIMKESLRGLIERRVS